MKNQSLKYAVLAGLLFCAAGAMNVQADTVVTFSVDMATNIANGTFNPASDTVAVSGTFNGWVQFGLVQEGSSTIYTNTYDDTADANGAVLGYKFYTSNTTGGETTADYNNRAARLPAVSGSTLVLPTPFYDDSGAAVTNNVTFQVDMTEQIITGHFDPNTQYVSVNGNFNGWNGQTNATTPMALTYDPNIWVTNVYTLSGVTFTNTSTNVYVGTFPIGGSPWSAQDYKFVIQSGSAYENVSAINADGGGNRFFAFNPDSNTTNALVSFNDAPYGPPIPVTFSVDMSAQLYYTNWNPSDGVFCQGINGDWNNDAANTMTNNSNGGNTNIYYVTYTLGPGSTEQYKFTYNGPSGTVYESPTSTGGNNRSYTVPSGVANAVVPTVYFNDLSVNDLLTTDVLVTFTVNMTNASQYPSGPAFDPGVDTVYVNGAWLGWLPWNPVNLMSYQLTNNPVGSEVYSGTYLIPKGNSIDITYKYSIDGTDNEAAQGQNHVRYVRTTATGAYSFPMDTFGDQYGEPGFGELKAGLGPNGSAALSWLGAPNVEVQTTTNLSSGAWVSHPETSGTVWSTGISSTNGLVSTTNWPASGGSLYFRLIQQ